MVKIKINKKRRDNIKRLHTATHIVNYASKKILGSHIWQNGSNIRENFATLDITHYKSLTFSELKEIELLSNKIVFSNIPVVIESLNRSDAEKKYGYTIYQGGAIPLKELRIVKVDDLDIEACGGLHVSKTNEIGLINIYKSEKVQDGLIRLFFKVSEDAVVQYQNIEKIINEISEYFNIEYENVFKTTLKFFENYKNTKKKLEKSEGYIFKLLLEKLDNNNDLEITIDYDLELPTLMNLINKIDSKRVIKTKSYIITNDLNYIPKLSYKKVITKKNVKIFIL